MDTNWARIAADLYDAKLDRALWPATLASVAHAFESEACVFCWRDFARGEMRFLEAGAVVNERPAAIDMSLLVDDEPWSRNESLMRSGAPAFPGSKAVSEKELRSSAFYREWMTPRNLQHALVIVLQRRDAAIHYLVILRSDEKSSFSDDDAELAIAVSGALGHAFAAASATARGNRERRAMWRGMDLMPLGCIVIDRSGRPIATNKAAQAIVASGDGISNVKGYLSIESHGRNVRLEDLLSDLLRNGRSSLDFSLRRISSARPLTCLMVPANGEVLEDDAPAAVLFISDPQRPVSYDATLISRLYGLSRAESRVAALLASGYRLEEVAGELGIAYETVRKHLKQIFGKTGVYRQAELVRMLVTGPAGLVF